MSASKEDLDRLAHSVWAGSAVSVGSPSWEGDGPIPASVSIWLGGNLMAMIGLHPRAAEAMSAALLVLAGEPTPLEKALQERIETLRLADACVPPDTFGAQRHGAQADELEVLLKEHGGRHG